LALYPKLSLWNLSTAFCNTFAALLSGAAKFPCSLINARYTSIYSSNFYPT
jgi:hypothetical protein